MGISAREERDRRAADERLAEAVAERLAEYEPLRDSGAQITVAVQDGVVHLRGLLRSATQPFEAARAAASIPGVREVRAEGLRTDEQTAIDVGAALARDPDLARAVLRVQVALGVVTLRGSLNDVRLVERALTRCRAVPGVRGVRSEVAVLVSPS